MTGSESERAGKPSPETENKTTPVILPGNKNYLPSEEIRDLLNQDHSQNSLRRLQDNYHRVPPQFRQQVIDYFSDALNEYKEGTKTGNEINQFLRSILPKKNEKNNTTKPVEFAEKILSENRFLTFGERSKTIFRYREIEGVWADDGISFVESCVQTKLEKEFISTNFANEVLGHVTRSTHSDRDLFANKSDKTVLVLQNCALDLTTLKPVSFSPLHYALNKLPAIYDPDASCTLFEKFINEILPGHDVLGVQEELGAILARQYKTKKFSIYLGPPDTGKTTLISVFLRLLGQQNVSSVSIQDLGSKNPFQIAPLYGKLANIRDDLSKDVIYSAGKLKELTGGFQVQGERKFSDQFNFENYAYLIFTCNSLPPIGEDDEGFFVRVIVRNFVNKFGGHTEADRDLIDKLTTPEELSGILNWALAGYKRLKENGFNFSNQTTTEQIADDYKRQSDPVWAFAEDCLIEESDQAETKEALYLAFKDFCRSNGIPLVSRDRFFKLLPEKVTVTSGQRELVKGQGKKHVFIGVKIWRNLNSEKGVPTVPVVPDQKSIEQSEQPEHPFYHLKDGESNESGDYP
jgi:putative DNA primase/helicase